MKNYLMNLIDELNFPSEAKTVLSQNYDIINSNTEFSSSISKFFDQYENNEIDWDKVIEEITALTGKVNIHRDLE